MLSTLTLLGKSPYGFKWCLPVTNDERPFPCAYCHWVNFLSEALTGVLVRSQRVTSEIWGCSCGRLQAHLLLLGGREEAHHLHGLLESFKVMFQVFSVFDLQVMLKNKVGNTLGISGPVRAACEDDFGWNRWGGAQDIGNEWAPLCCLFWASL